MTDRDRRGSAYEVGADIVLDRVLDKGCQKLFVRVVVVVVVEAGACR